MERQNKKKSILAQLSPRIKRTAVAAVEPGQPSTNELQEQNKQSLQIKKRQKFSMSENRTIMKCYYNSEPEKRGYQRRMYQLWKQEYADSKITELRLADQRRLIIRNQMFSEVELEEIQKICKIETPKSDLAPVEAPIRSGVTAQLEPDENLERQQEAADETLGTITQRQQELKDQILAHAGSNAERKRLPALKNISKKRLVPLMEDINSALATVNVTSIEELNQLAYSTAVIVTEELGLLQQKPIGKPTGKPKWKIRLELKIKSLRSDASNLKNIKEQKLNNQKIKDYLTKKYWLSTRKIEEALEIVKQQITATARKIERYEARITQYRQNQTFQSNQRQFYQNLHQQTDKKIEKPEVKITTKFWKDLWEVEKDYNRTAGWIKEFEKEFSGSNMQQLEITPEMIAKERRK